MKNFCRILIYITIAYTLSGCGGGGSSNESSNNNAGYSQQKLGSVTSFL